VDWVSGGAFAIKKDLFEKIHGFDENFFMYFEDVDLCRRASSVGGKILYLPQFTIRHFGGQSYDDTRKQKVEYYQSQDYYLKKHFSRASAFFIALLRKVLRKV